MFRIERVVISLATEEHIWVKHQVTPKEAEEVCFVDPLALRGRDGSYAIYEQTKAGRYLVVFLYPRGPGVFVLASASNLDDRERRRYLRSKGR